jgi:hypothetical protein
MGERRKWKNVNTEEDRKSYTMLRNELKRATNNAKKDYLENICNEIMDFQRTGRYDLIYMKTKESGWKETQGIQNLNRRISQCFLINILSVEATSLSDNDGRLFLNMT